MIIYAALTILNFVFLLYFTGFDYFSTVLSILSFLANQYFLYKGLKLMLKEKAKTLSSTSFLILKFAVLLIPFIWFIFFKKQGVLILSISYIFQLLILVISIKKEVKI